jgi:two-component sensor histidine kinase
MISKIKHWYQSTQVNTLAVLAIGLLLLGGAAYESTASQMAQNKAIEWSSHSFEVLLLTEKINSDTSILDRRAREFVYRRTPGARVEFEQVANDIPEKYKYLQKLVKDDKAQLAEVDLARNQTRGQIVYFKSAIIKFDNVPGQIGNKMKTLRDGDRLTKLTQSSLRILMVRENAYLDQRRAQLRKAQHDSSVYMFIFLLSGCGIISFSFRSVMAANMTLAQKARLEERESRAGELMASEQRANEQARLLGALNSASANLASEHDLAKIVSDVVDYGVKITGAEFGAFFFVMEDNGKPSLHLEALSGIPRDHFPEGDILRATDLFTKHITDVLIVDDVREHISFGKNEPHFGYPVNHPAVKSYIGIPIISNTGVQIGALLLGHREVNKFTTMHEQSVRGLAGMTSIVIENAHLYSAAQAELEERKRYEADLVKAAERQHLLLRELNHRVKNTLVTVQSIAMQTKNAAISKLGLANSPERLGNLNRFYKAFESRLLALSGTHDLLVNGAWSDVSLRDSVNAAIQPLIDMERVTVRGPRIKLSPNAAVTLNMVFHELSTNAIKYGAASNDVGRIMVEWEVVDGLLRILWSEHGGPAVDHPDGVGFGSKLLDRAISREMKGRSEVTFLPEGIECFMQMPLSVNIRQDD